MTYRFRRSELVLFGLFCLIAGMQIASLLIHIGTTRQWLFALGTICALGCALAMVRVVRLREAGRPAA